jgi:dGTP triphosphohydrolase
METGIIYKPEKFESYIIVPRCILRDERLSTGAVGLFCFLISHDSKFRINVQYTVNAFKDGKDAIYSRFKELIELGYLEKKQVKDKSNKFLGYNYIITLPEDNKTAKGKSGSGKAVYGKSATKYNNNIIHNIKQYKEITVKCYESLVLLFPNEYRPKNDNEKNNWLKVIDELERLDKITARQIYYITKKTLEDDFWKNNFTSPLKLRRKNKDGVKWVYVFKNKYAKDMLV